ncbi:ribonuclease III [SAR202 cluster bacterium AD-802-E10_MRT_200m]|nr:ribonuclease III [SAR202 cluster bacterium AD-802-E10_MRT_200m]MQF82790.1 ribonuclease III [SAR202 cluster bacterium AD-802-E10_MRT_200m]
MTHSQKRISSREELQGDDQRPHLDLLEKSLGTQFQNRDLLQKSIIHSSYVNEYAWKAPESNERLEFLGDALLGLVVAETLYKKYPEMSEGQLTAARASLVKGETLARVARRLSLGQMLYLGQGEESSGGRDRDSNLAAVVEAIIGAVLLDQGYTSAMSFVMSLFHPELDLLSTHGIPMDAKSHLQEVIQRQEGNTPIYRIAKELGPDHSKYFVAEVLINDSVVGVGRGRRKSIAEQHAAKSALKELNISYP